MKERVHVLLAGRVQGVAFRDSARSRAIELGVAGTVRNLSDGRVELIAEGPRDLLESLVTWCRQGPVFARVDAADVRWEPYLAEFSGFRIVS